VDNLTENKPYANPDMLPCKNVSAAPLDTEEHEAKVEQSIDATVDFTEVDIDPDLSAPPHAVTPAGILPMDPAPIEGTLRKATISVPDAIEDASGFTLFGRRIKSLMYSTDVAVIRNSNADAVFAVYPFTAQPAITQALLTAAECPVFVGVGGGTTAGKRSVQLAAVSEMQGVAGVIVNSPASPEMVEHIAHMVDIPVVATVVRADDAHAKVRAGAKILNIAAGKNTPEVLRELRRSYPNLPLIAPGGKTPESIQATIGAGANAIIWTPPSAQMMQQDMMARYREQENAGLHEEPSIDPISAGDINPIEGVGSDIPFTDDVIAHLAQASQRRRERRNAFFSRRK